MPEAKKQYVLIKTSPNDVLFTLRNVENPQLTRLVHLTKKTPQQPLPLTWALSVIADPALYGMYKKGYFSFDDNDGLAQAAYDAGYWFDTKFDFKPARKEDDGLIFSILKVGNRVKIEEAIKEYGEERVKDVAINKCKDLNQNVIQMLEKKFGIQLVVDGVDEEMADDE